MTSFDLLMFRFLLASAGCLVAGSGVWMLTVLLRRYLPAVAAQRSVWLLGQLTIAATFFVILLPHSERLRLVPQIELPDPTSASAPAAAAPTRSGGDAITEPVAAAANRSWLASGAQAWLTAYLLGLGWTAARLIRARRALDALAAAGNEVRHDGAPPRAHVIEVDAPISPMLFGFFQPRLLLPRHLREFEPAQQQMMVEHEFTHLRRHDLHWMSAGIVLQALLWFNPFMRMLRAQLTWAQELGCDRDVLRGRSPSQRKAYAAALVAQLRMQQRPMESALAFGSGSARLLAARIGLIRDSAGTSRGIWPRMAAIGALACIFLGSLALQPALAWRSEAVADVTTEKLESCLLVVDATSGATLSRAGQCDVRVTPASTFNIVVSLMGYDAGILRDDRAPKMPFKKGYVDYNPSWRQATDPTMWIRNSVLWYAQQVVAQLGAARFEDYIRRFNYGNRDVSGDAGENNGLSMSWVGSSLKISAVEQVAFLRNVVNRELPLSAKAYDMTSTIMKPVTLPNGWRLQGKTGTASPVLADGRDDEHLQYGWFVGWAKKGDRTVVFAKLILDQRQPSKPAGPRARDMVLRDLPAHLPST